MKATATYEIEHLAGLSDGQHEEEVDVTVFNRVVYFRSKGQPRFPLATGTWIAWGRPRKLKITVEPK